MPTAAVVVAAAGVVTVGPLDPRPPLVATLATVAVALVVKAAVVAVWKACADKICRSPERPDLRMSQEEAQGWLISALFARELLPPEARGIGKRVDYYASAEEKAEKRGQDSRRRLLRLELAKGAKVEPSGRPLLGLCSKCVREKKKKKSSE